MYKYIFFNFLLQIDLDFEYKYPLVGNNLTKKWEEFLIKIIPIFAKTIKDKLNTAELEKSQLLPDSEKKGKFFGFHFI